MHQLGEKKIDDDVVARWIWLKGIQLSSDCCSLSIFYNRKTLFFCILFLCYLINSSNQLTELLNEWLNSRLIIIFHYYKSWNLHEIYVVDVTDQRLLVLSSPQTPCMTRHVVLVSPMSAFHRSGWSSKWWFVVILKLKLKNKI